MMHKHVEQNNRFVRRTLTCI